MKKLLWLLLLAGTAACQQVNSNIIPASPGLSLGTSNQRWNGQFNNINIAGTCTLNGAPCGTGGGGGGSAAKTPSVQTASSYPFAAADSDKFTVFKNSGAVSATISSPATAGFGLNKSFAIGNGSTGSVTLTCACSINVNGATGSTVVLSQGDFVNLVSDGASTYYAQGGALALTATNNTFAAGTYQTFLGDPVNSNLPAFIVGAQGSISAGAQNGAVIGQLSALSSGSFHLSVWDAPSASANVMLLSADTPCDMGTSCTGDPTTPAAMQKNPQFIAPFTDNSTGISYSIPNQPNGNFVDLQAGVTTPFCQVTPATGHIFLCYGSDGKMQGSFNNDALGDLLRRGNDIQEKRGVAGCTTAASIGGVCASPVTVTWTTSFSDTNYAVNCSSNGAPTNLPSGPYVVSKANGSVVVNYYAITAAAASWATIDCEAVHD